MSQMTAVVQQLQKERARAAREVAQLDAALAALNGAGGERSGNRTTSEGSTRGGTVFLLQLLNYSSHLTHVV